MSDNYVSTKTSIPIVKGNIMTYWNSIIEPQLKEVNIKNILNFDDDDVVISIFRGDTRYEKGEISEAYITEIMLETKRTWIQILCILGEVFKITEENDRGNVTTCFEKEMSFNMSSDILVSEEYGYRTWIWTPSTDDIGGANKLLQDFLEAMAQYFLISDPRAVDPNGRWVPVHLEFSDDEDCEGWWETYHGIKINNFPEPHTGEYFLHIHEREDTWFTKREPHSEEELKARKDFIESITVKMRL